MLDQWFNQEIEDHFEKYNRLLLVDPKEQYDFLIEKLSHQEDIGVLSIRNKVDDLKSKYKIEKSGAEQQFLIYSTLPKEELNYCREYGETNPTSEALRKSLPRFIQSKLDFTASDLKPSDYIMLGRESIGKGEEFWKDVKAKGIEAVLGNFERNLVELLSRPEEKRSEFGDRAWEVFCQKIENITELTASGKPPNTVADEFVDYLFDKILDGRLKNADLNSIYEEWIRDWENNKRLVKSASQYDIPPSQNIWDVASNHPFKVIDRAMVRDVIKHLEDKKWIRSHKPVIRRRLKARNVLNLLEIDYWKHILTLVNADIDEEAHQIQSMYDYINKVYPEDLSKFDRAIRHLYMLFEDDQNLKQRVANYYTGLMQPYWNEWFGRFKKEYHPSQPGLLEQIFDNSNRPCAIIVGDALSFDLAQEIKKSLSSSAYGIQLTPVKGDYPSTTGVNMSRLFDSSGSTMCRRNEREERLSKSLDVDIEVSYLDEYQESKEPSEYLILYQSDTDDILEKLSHRGLKYLRTAKRVIQEEIQNLLNNGYKEVHVVSDHGFVLYGSVEEADKIPVKDLPDQMELKDRYVATEEPLDSKPKNTLHIEKEYKNYRHLYFALGLKPFRSPNEYGFAHGGITPQELLTSHLSVRSKQEAIGRELDVNIINKEELQTIPVANADIKVKAGTTDDLINSNRRVYLAFYRQGDKFKDSNIIEIKAGEEMKLEVRFDNMEDCQVELLDAETRRTLDSAKLHFESARDLGGLMDE